MGSWYETCGISNLPICDGDEIVAIILQQAPYMHGGETCYISDNLVPASFVFSGTYGDYGRLEGYSDETLKLLLNREYFEKTENGFIAIKYDDIDDFLKDAFHEDVYVKVRYNDYTDGVKSPKNTYRYVPLTTMFIHKGLYDHLMDSFKSRKIYGKNNETWESSLKNNLKIRLEQFSESKQKGGTFLKLSDFWRLSNTLGFVVADFFADCVYNKNTLSEDVLFEKLVEMKTLEMILCYMRSGYLTYSGKGSQAREMYLHKLMAEWILKFYNEKLQENLEEMDEDSTELDIMAETIFDF